MKRSTIFLVIASTLGVFTGNFLVGVFNKELTLLKALEFASICVLVNLTLWGMLMAFPSIRRL